MAPLTTTRTLFELRVGSTHTIEVLLQIRLSDIAWWNADLYDHERQLYKLIGRRVLPKECGEEIEAHRAKIKNDKNAKSKKEKGDVVIGEANLKKKADKTGKGGGRKRGGRNAKKETKSSKKQKVADKKGKDAKGTNTTYSYEPEEQKLKILRESGKWVMGRTIQMCYKMEEIERSSAATLVYRQRENSANSEQDNPAKSTQNTTEKQSQSSIKVDDNNKMVPLATFRSWKKLPKRVNLWVFKFDPDDPCDLSSSEGGGFPRPSLLPMADIFRSAADEDE